MIEKKVQKAVVFHGINHGSFAMHLLQVLGHVLIKLYVFEELVEEPRKKKCGFLVELIGIKWFCLIRFHDRFEIISMFITPRYLGEAQGFLILLTSFNLQVNQNPGKKQMTVCASRIFFLSIFYCLTVLLTNGILCLRIITKADSLTCNLAAIHGGNYV